MLLNQLCCRNYNVYTGVVKYGNYLLRSQLRRQYTAGGFRKQLTYVKKNITSCNLTFAALVLGVNLPVVYITLPHLHALARVKTTRRLNSTEITRSFNRQCEESGGDIYSLLRYLKEDWYLLLGAILLAVSVAYLNTQIPLLLGKIATALNSLHEASSDQFLSIIKVPALNLLKVYSCQALGTAAYISVLSHVGERFASRMRLALFKSLIFQKMEFYDTHRVGELINRLTGDVQEVKSSFKQFVSLGIRNLIQFTGCCVSLYQISPDMTLLLFASSIVLTLIGSGIGSALRHASRFAQDQIASSTSCAEEVIGNIKTVKSFSTEENEIEKYEKSLRQAADAYAKLGLGIGIFTSLTHLATNGMVIQTLCYGGYLLSHGQVVAGDLMAFLASVQIVQRSLQNMSVLVSQIVKGSTAAARVAQYLDPDAGREHGVSVLHTDGHILFKDVSYSFPCRPDVTVLDNFNLEIKPGQTVALCGASGAGKSTVASLLEKFYTLDSGSITVDGFELDKVDTRWLRGSYLGYISQEPVLFATSIKENIRYGRKGASDEEIEKVARAANAHHFISEFPSGYETLVGERGATLSGGQKQRIAIARALLKDPKVLILDEATSALDASSEKVVSEALQNLCRGRTVIVIAHRLSTIKDADCIVVLDHGAIVESGKHETLLERQGFYYKLVKNQTHCSDRDTLEI